MESKSKATENSTEPTPQGNGEIARRPGMSDAEIPVEISKMDSEHYLTYKDSITEGAVEDE